MSPAESADQIRQELAAEREQLGSAVQELRTEVDALRRKLPYVAAAALAAGLLIKLARRRSSR